MVVLLGYRFHYVCLVVDYTVVLGFVMFSLLNLIWFVIVYSTKVTGSSLYFMPLPSSLQRKVSCQQTSITSIDSFLMENNLNYDFEASVRIRFLLSFLVASLGSLLHERLIL